MKEWARALDDASVTDLVISGEGLAHCLRAGVWEPVPWPLTLGWEMWVQQFLETYDLHWDARYPFLNVLIGSQVRVHLWMRHSREGGPVCSFRKLHGPQVTWPLPQMKVLSRLFQRSPFLIAGATGSGKTSLLEALLSAVKTDRVILLEETPELTLQGPHWVRMLARSETADERGALTLRALFRESLRMRPDRIILGECRGPEVFDFLQALNSGHGGGATTIHASSVRQALHRVELLATLGLEGRLDPLILREWLVAAKPYILFLQSEANKPQILSVSRLVYLEGGMPILDPFPWPP